MCVTARRCAASRRDAGNVPSVMGWAVEAVADYVDNIRPRFGSEEHPAMWLTERGGLVAPAEINARFRRLPRYTRAAENPYSP